MIEDKLKDLFYYVKIVNLTEIKVDYYALAEEYNLKGVFVKKMLEKIDSAEKKEEKEKFKLALKMGLEALDYRQVRNYED